MVQLPEGVAPFIHINQNDFSGRKHKKQKEEDIAVCECKYDANNPESACGERCLNVLTSTECTPGYCRCNDDCKNQRFQKCEYAKAKLFRTEGRGWGLLADENIKAGRFIIEYCGEVLSSEEAQQRSHTYEAEGLRDAYIISLSANYFIDATKKGSLARFINHSCQPNCETRKWTVLGEVRVGIFAKQDISVGTELAYDYNFEWYGGANVRCLCGAAKCSKFLGAKSSGFQEHNHVWEDDDDRYTVDKIPLYDSAEDDTSSKLPKATISLKPESMDTGNYDYFMMMDCNMGPENQFDPTSLLVEPLSTVPMESVAMNTVKSEESEKTKLSSLDTQQAFPQKNPIMPPIQISSANQSFHIGQGSVPKKRSQNTPKRKSKHVGRKQIDAKHVAKLFASKEAQEEIIKNEEIKNQATSKLDSIYNEIRPAIEEHERDSQDNVPTEVAEKWIEANCAKMKAEFGLYFSIVKNTMCPPQKSAGETKPSEGDKDSEMSSLTKLEFNALAVNGGNYLSRQLDAKFHLQSKKLGDAIEEGNKMSLKEKASALIFLRRHIHDDLKNEYLTEEDPLSLWKSLKDRYNHQKMVILPIAHSKFLNLRYQDFKTVSEYNSTLFNIVSRLKLCGEKVTDAQMIEKTLSTFHASNVLLQQQY